MDLDMYFTVSIGCNSNLEMPYVTGVSLTQGPAGRRRRIWTSAAAQADGYPYQHSICGCSNTNLPLAIQPTRIDDGGHGYFCDTNVDKE